MADSSVLQQACPLLFVKDIRKSVDQMVATLGFAEKMVHGEPPAYAIVCRDGLDVHLTTNPAPDSVHEGKGAFYAYVTGVDSLFEHASAHGANVFQGLTLQPYGMKEFAVTDLDGNMMCFGEEVAPYSG